MRDEVQIHCEPIDAARWDRIVYENPVGWFWHRADWRDYTLLLKGGIDRSFAMLDERGNILALCPLIQEGATFLFGGTPCPHGIMTHEEDGTIFDCVRQVTQFQVQALAALYGVRLARFRTMPLAQEETFAVVNADIAHALPWKSRVIDLRGELDRSAVRDSYRNLINRFGRDGGIVTPLDAKDFKDYADTHKRKYATPRPDATYAMQERWLAEGLAMLIGVARPDGSYGYAYWYTWKHWAYYGSGVFEGDNLAHACLWSSLSYLKQAGLHYAELGWQGAATDPVGQQKEFFKAGFGGRDWPMYVVEVWLGNAPSAHGVA